jgi:hypothetical protein
VDNVSSIHQEDFGSAGNDTQQHESVKEIGIALSVFFRQEKEKKEKTLDDP